VLRWCRKEEVDLWESRHLDCSLVLRDWKVLCDSLAETAPMFEALQKPPMRCGAVAVCHALLRASCDSVRQPSRVRCSDTGLSLYVHSSLRCDEHKPNLLAIVDTGDAELQQWTLEHCGPDVALANLARADHDRAAAVISQCFSNIISAWSSLSPLAGVQHSASVAMTRPGVSPPTARVVVYVCLCGMWQREPVPRCCSRCSASWRCTSFWACSGRCPRWPPGAGARNPCWSASSRT
jgi:hypothetical protein